MGVGVGGVLSSCVAIVRTWGLGAGGGVSGESREMQSSRLGSYAVALTICCVVRMPGFMCR